MTEQWQKIIGYEIYSISNQGRIRNDNTQHIKKLFPNRYGSPIVILITNNKRKHKSYNTTRLMRQWMPPQPGPEYCLYHKNGDKYDNRVENLIWTTNSQRIKDGFKKKRRTSKGFSKPLTINEKQIITQMWNLGRSQVQIAKRIGRNNSTISKYLSGSQ